MKVLVLAPHPDDEVIGCGGSLALHATNGDEVICIYVTTGGAGSLHIPTAQLITQRQAEARAGAAKLGLHTLEFLSYPDGQLQFLPSVVTEITTILRKHQPHVVYLPHRYEAHHDHRSAYLVGWEAIQRAAAEAFPEVKGEPWRVPTVLAYEVWTPLREFQVTRDISKVMEQKVQALQCHTSQLLTVAYDEAVRGLNRYRGALTGQGIYVECFEVLRAPATVFTQS